MDSKSIYDFLIKIQSIAKIGLIYSKDPYALTNYQEINDLSTKFLEDFQNVDLNRSNYFERNIYPTPNVSVRTFIFNEDKTKVLLVREASSHEYSLPGGWADLYDSPSTAAKNECLQEAGAEVEMVRLVGITDRTPYKNKTSVPEYVIIFEGKINVLHKEHEYETDDVNFFSLDDLPTLSRKSSKEEFLRFIDAAKSGKTIFD